MIKRLIVSSLLVTAVIGAMSLGASAKWKVDSHNNYSWIKNGVKVTGWEQIGENWYCFGEDGIMKTGWMMDNGNWYYFWSNGAMAHDSWLTNGGCWYYFDESGKYVRDSATINNRKYDFSKIAVIESEDFK